ncbi:MAG: hypoxanthine phosphoribosyltransferase [Chloroflexota bacterium]
MTDEKEPVVLYAREQIVEAVGRLASEIRHDYQGKNPVIIGILKGSFMFIADLIRELAMPVEVEFVVLSSYGSETESAGKVRMAKGVHTTIKGRHVLVVEDIIDSGYTVSYLLDYLRQRRPASLKLCVLLDKELRRKVPVVVDYRGFRVPNKFVVGYGLDYDEKYRYLSDIRCIEEPTPPATSL